MDTTFIVSKPEKYIYSITPLIPVIPIVGIDKIQRAFEAVCNAFMVNQEVLKNDRSRKRNMCMCRQAVWKIVKEDDRHIHFKSLAQFFGDFDHTTVIHGIQAITNAMLTDDLLVRKYQAAIELYIASATEKPDENYYDHAN